MNAPAVLDFKSASLYALRLVLRSTDAGALITALEARLDAAGDFFVDEPVVIDAQALEQPTDWRALAEVIRARGLALVGVSAPDALRDSVQAAGLSCVILGAPASPAPAADAPLDAPVPATVGQLELVEIDQQQAGVAEVVAPTGAAPATAEPIAASRQAPAADATRPTLILDRSLRSGQKVYARQADLVIIGMVSPGAEVIADGSIHVYGPLRGKAMAGARGDESARIFTTQLDAELVAVAGVYRVIETQLPGEVHRKPATVRLHGGQLQLQALAV